ncbi:MAG TPA: hypothetical protein VLB32_04585, partial [Candidatus Acidoferrales bacterium]|nr:hypothetical protein [Candidatus Acidoferrales bacterium]
MSVAVRDTKTTLKAELGIIHPMAWLVAGAVLLFWLLVPMPFLYHSARPGPGEPPLWLLAAALSFAGL